jgi:hypothetical protein
VARGAAFTRRASISPPRKPSRVPRSFGRAPPHTHNPAHSDPLHGQSILEVLRTSPLTAPAPGSDRRLSGEAHQTGGQQHSPGGPDDHQDRPARMDSSQDLAPCVLCHRPVEYAVHMKGRRPKTESCTSSLNVIIVTYISKATALAHAMDRFLRWMRAYCAAQRR